MSSKLIIMTLFIFLLLVVFFFDLSIAESFCNCTDDRTICLTYPYLTGQDIEVLQERLKIIGFYDGIINGRYDLATYLAVIKLQNKGDLKVNGVVDHKTWDLLGYYDDSIKTTYKNDKPDGELVIRVYLNKRQLILYEDGKVYKVYPVTVGKAAEKSPVGEWYIKNKYERAGTGGVLGTRWMGLSVSWGVYGIHGTNKPWEIGTASSKGCIRLHNRHIEELFQWVRVATRVEIIGPKPLKILKNLLKVGEMGEEIVLLQEKLRQKGFYNNYLDGVYGSLTELAVKELETQYGFRVDGIADINVLIILGINSQ
ncbi:MAG: hypothetical protein FH762_15730 [Firmicutes bacterium]|nr:hypothetical protein [Bacillota bacterium]